MKKVLGLALAFSALAACNPTEKLLVGSWKLQSVEFNESDFHLTKQQKPGMVKQMLDSCRFNFNKNHTYSARLMGSADTGTWKLNRAGDSLFTQTADGRVASYIKSISASQMEVYSPAAKNSVIRFVLVPQ